MAVPPQAPKQMKRQSNRKSRNDFFHKMLQLEKATNEQRQRSASTSPVLNGHVKHNSVNGSPAAKSPSPLSPMNHNRQSAPPAPRQPEGQKKNGKPPSMTENRAVNGNVKAPEPLRIVTKSVSQDSVNASEICLSPSWSDHGQREKKEEKRRREKELKEQRRREEEENRRPPKRLNKKPPPAAMDTQKMANDLRKPRRNSISSLLGSRSSSREPSQERGREEKRLSGSSVASFMARRRSSSRQDKLASPSDDDKNPQNPDSYRPIVSPLAPKLPSFRWKSPSETKNAASWGDSNVSEDLVGFPYNKHEKKAMTSEAKSEEKQSDPIAHLAQEKSIRPMIRSSTEPALKPSEKTERAKMLQARDRRTFHDQSKSTLSTKVDHTTSKSDSKDIREQTAKGSAGAAAPSPSGTPTSQKSQRSDEVAAELIAMLSENKPKPYQHAKDTTKPKSCSNASKDGSSYVHKQRMYEQQRSIAGFEEQEALQMFNEQAIVAAMQQDIKDMQAASINSKPRSRDVSPISTASRETKRERSSSRGPREAIRKESSPARRTSSQQPRQSALSPLKQVSSAPDDSDDEQEQKLKRAKEEISLKMQNIQVRKTDKILGFRRRHKDKDVSTASKFTEPKAAAAESKFSLEVAQDSDKQAKKGHRMSSHLPFRHRRDSSSGPVMLNLKDSTKTASRDNLRAVSNPKVSTDGSQDGKLSAPSTPTGTMTALKQTESSDSNESFHSVTEKPVKAPTTAAQSSNKQPRQPLHRRTTSEDAAAKLAAVYSEGILTPSSEESLHSIKQTAAPKPDTPTLSASKETVPAPPSLPRSHSIPNIPATAIGTCTPTSTSAMSSTPNLDFLPQLKHQPLPTKSPRRLSNNNANAGVSAAGAGVGVGAGSSAESSPTRITIPRPVFPDTGYKSPLQQGGSEPNLPSSLAVVAGLKPPQLPFAGLGGLGSSSKANGRGLSGGVGEAKSKPMAKLFVICCKCRFWHDLPAKRYEAMAFPKEAQKLEGETAGKGEKAGDKKAKEGKGVEGGVGGGVQCPWCEHGMRTSCCQGWTTVVYLHERHH